MKPMDETEIELRWTPVRRGGIYCSPACGGKCTWAAYNRAKVAADALADLLGQGWTSYVYENLGWYYSAVHDSGYLSVSPSGNAWSAFVALERDQAGGKWTATANTPRQAVKQALGLAKAAMQVIQLVIDATKDQA